MAIIRGNIRARRHYRRIQKHIFKLLLELRKPLHPRDILDELAKRGILDGRRLTTDRAYLANSRANIKNALNTLKFLTIIKQPGGPKTPYVIHDYEPDEHKARKLIPELLKKHRFITPGMVLLEIGESPENQMKRDMVYRVASSIGVKDRIVGEKKIRKGAEEAVIHCISTINLVDQLKKALEGQELSDSAEAALKAIEKKLVEAIC